MQGGNKAILTIWLAWMLALSSVGETRADESIRSWNEFLSDTWVELTQNYTIDQVKAICWEFKIDFKFWRIPCADKIKILEQSEEWRQIIDEVTDWLEEIIKK